MHISNTEDRRKQSLDRHGLLLFEGTRILKKYETKQCVSKNFKKSKSVDYKKLWKRALDGYAGKSRRNILKVSLNDAEFKGFKVSSLKKRHTKASNSKGSTLFLLPAAVFVWKISIFKN